jgi:protoporphyrinogen oxidase
MKKNVVILGGGVGGLSAAWMLARTGHYHVTVLERAPFLGGACATFRHGDFLLDHGPHKCYSAIPGILDELRALMGEEFLRLEKSNTIHLFGQFLKYPISLVDLAPKMGFKNLLRCAAGAARVTLGRRSNHEADSYEEYVMARFGRGLYEIVFEPLADKIWGDPATLSADIARTRIPSKGVLDTALRAAGLRKESELTDARYFYYPRKGFGRITERMAEETTKHGGILYTSAAPLQILRDGMTIRSVVAQHNHQTITFPCDLLISSIPLPALVQLLGGGKDSALESTLRDAKQLQFRDAFLVYIFLQKDVVTRHHWLFFPDREVVFGRVFEQKLLSPEMAPSHQTVLCCDFTDYPEGELARQPDADLACRCVQDLTKVGLIDPSWVTETMVKRLSGFYPRYDLLYKTTISDLYKSLRRFDNLLSTGRIGFYNYNNSDHCLDMGKFISAQLDDGKPPQEIWSELEERVANYRIVD